MPPEIEAIFTQQRREVRGPWELQDLEDRYLATVRWYSERKWDGLSWILASEETPASAPKRDRESQPRG
jgi:hypothetical protein